MPQTHIRTDIQRALNQFTNGELHENATHLLKVLGYESQRTLHRDTNTTDAFREDFDPDNLINPQKAHLHEWQTADFLFQLTADEIRQHTQEVLTFNEDPGVDESIYQSYLFLAITLKGDDLFPHRTRQHHPRNQQTLRHTCDADFSTRTRVDLFHYQPQTESTRRCP